MINKYVVRPALLVAVCFAVSVFAILLGASPNEFMGVAAFVWVAGGKIDAIFEGKK